jgi:hypothetical protein
VFIPPFDIKEVFGEQSLVRGCLGNADAGFGTNQIPIKDVMNRANGLAVLKVRLFADSRIGGFVCFCGGCLVGGFFVTTTVPPRLAELPFSISRHSFGLVD